jgi:electron transfer flavoprotein alpha subunit
MAGIWVVAEIAADGSVARISLEMATLARALADAAGTTPLGIVVAPEPGPAATALADYLPEVVALAEPSVADRPWAMPAAARIAAMAGDAGGPELILTSAGPDGRDVAGALSALLDLPVLANATGIAWDAGPAVSAAIFGGKLLTTSAFTSGRGIVTVRPGAVDAAPATAAGAVRAAQPAAELAVPAVRVVEQVAETTTTTVPLEEARIIVSGGRGMGGPDGFRLVEALAAALGGAVGASRAAVDSGWIAYAQQVGQTGKIVKPELYVALGISGAIQHKVGMQTSGTIVAVNRDPDAPIVEFADLAVVGDVFEVVPAILEALRTRDG